MSSSAIAPQSAAAAIGIPGRLRKALTPSFADFLYVSMIVWLFMLGTDTWGRLLMDGDTGWHIRTGEYILDHGAVPRTDLFSFSKPGAPWFAWEWASDVLYGWLNRVWGLKGIVILAAAQIALYAIVVLRYIIWRGGNTFIALGVCLLAVGASSVHFLARPHLFTLVLVPVTIWLLERDRKMPDRWVWALIPITAVWTNLHGGFLAGIACMGLFAAGVAVETLWNRAKWDAPIRYGLVLILCCIATLANPYGYHLHQHVADYLNSSWIREAVQEFQSPSFRSENLMQFEMLLLAGLAAAGWALWRRSVVEALLILFWAHESLGAVRHATIYATVAAPVIAVEATRIWDGWIRGLKRNSVPQILDELASDMSWNFRWTSVWPAIFLCGLLAWDTTRWPTDFPDLRFPVKMVSRHKAELSQGRVLTTDQWADYLIYRFYPESKVFFDGRSDFYGAALGKQYVRVSSGQYDWRKIMNEQGFDVALIPMDWSLGSLLKISPEWKLAEDDGKSLLFLRVTPTTGTKVPKNADNRLMKLDLPSEIPIGDRIEMKQERTASSGNSSRVNGVPPEMGAWLLPSGQPLVEFALKSGFVAPGLLKRTPSASSEEAAPRGNSRRRGASQNVAAGDSLL